MPSSPPVRTGLDIPSHGVRLSAWRYHAATDAWETAGRAALRGDGPRLRRHQGRRPGALRRAVRRRGGRRGASSTTAASVRRRASPASTSTTGGTAPTTAPWSRTCAASTASTPTGSCSGAAPTPVATWWPSPPADPRIAGVISQGAAMDGLAAVLEIRRYAGVRQLLRLTGHALLGTVLRRHSHADRGRARLAGRHHLPRRPRGLLPDHGPDVREPDARPRHAPDPAQPPGHRGVEAADAAVPRGRRPRHDRAALGRRARRPPGPRPGARRCGSTSGTSTSTRASRSRSRSRRRWPSWAPCWRRPRRAVAWPHEHAGPASSSAALITPDRAAAPPCEGFFHVRTGAAHDQESTR